VQSYFKLLLHDRPELYETVYENIDEHEIDGDMLMKMEEHDLGDLGFVKVGDRLRYWDEILLLRRVSSNLVETRKVQVPGYIGSMISTLTFGWNTLSEGKDGAEMKEEFVNSCTNVAVVSSLVWTLAWAMFFSIPYDCFCGGSKSAQPGECWCMGGYTEDPDYKEIWSLIPISAFHFLSAMCVTMYWWSTLIAVVQLIAINELSDDKEVEYFMDILGGVASVPGLYMVLGAIIMPIPFFIVAFCEPTFGIMWARIMWERQDQFTPIMCAVIGSILVVIFLASYYWIIPMMVQKIYKAKAESLEVSTKELLRRQLAAEEYLEQKARGGGV